MDVKGPVIVLGPTVSSRNFSPVAVLSVAASTPCPRLSTIAPTAASATASVSGPPPPDSPCTKSRINVDATSIASAASLFCTTPPIVNSVPLDGCQSKTVVLSRMSTRTTRAVSTPTRKTLTGQKRLNTSVFMSIVLPIRATSVSYTHLTLPTKA